MKKAFLFTGTLCTLLFFAACNDQATSGTHQHEDGSTHSDHTPDTAKLQQQEFVVGDSTQKDTTTKEVHTHDGGEPHAH